MSNPIPSSLALTTPADGTTLIASRDRNNDNAIQTAVNALITAMAGGTAGQVLQAVSSSAVDWNGGTYTAYSPTWTTSGTAPAVGNMATTARYARLGKLVHAYGIIQFGTTTTFGTGSWSFALPVAPVAATAQQVGTIDMRHNASGARQIAWATLGSSLLVPVTQATWGGVEQNLTNAIPWTWAQTDWIAWNLLYEAA